MCKQVCLRKTVQKIFLALLIFSIIHTPILAKPISAQDATLPVYIVQSGDTLYDIAIQFYTTVDEIMAVNGLSNGDSLLVGDRLLIPGLEGMQGTLDRIHPAWCKPAQPQPANPIRPSKPCQIE